MTKKQGTLVVLLGLWAVSSAGCATVGLDRRRAMDLSAVRVAPVATKNVTYYGHLPSEYEADERTGIFDTIASLFKRSQEERKRSKRMQAILEKAGVDVPGNVHALFTDAVAKTELFEQVLSAGEAEAEFVMDASFGVLSETTTDDVFTPWLNVEARLVRGDGSVLWRKQVRVAGTESGLQPFPFPDPFVDPELVQSHFADAAEEAVRELMHHLLAR